MLVLAGIAASASPAASTEKIACNTKKFLVEFSPTTQGAVANTPTDLLAVTSPTSYRLSTACSAAGKASVVKWGNGCGQVGVEGDLPQVQHAEVGRDRDRADERG